MDLLKRERIQPDMSDGMKSRWVMGNRRNTRMGRSAGRDSGRTADVDADRHERIGTISSEAAPAGQPWKGVRPAKIAKAKALLRQDDYPPRQVLESVAELLAEHLEKPQ